MDIKDQYDNVLNRMENDGTIKDKYSNRIACIENDDPGPGGRPHFFLRVNPGKYKYCSMVPAG